MLSFIPIGNCLFPIELFPREIFVPHVLCWPFFLVGVMGMSKACAQRTVNSF